MTQLALHPARSWADPSLLRRRWLVLAAIVFIGYALDGRGFAYIGFPPIFVGEIVLLTGAALMLLGRRWNAVFSSIPLWLLMALAGWGLLRTVPFLGTYQFDAIRDAALWLYGIFAIIFASLLISEPKLLALIIDRYRTCTYVLLIGTPIMSLMHRLVYFERPVWPWAPDVAVIQQKEGDVLVHMAAILAFWVSGLVPKVAWIWISLLTISIAMMGSTDRAGLVAIGAVLAITWFFRPHSKIPQRMLIVIAVALFALWVSGLRWQVPGGKGRDLSFDQLVTNAVSILYDTGEDHMDSTKEWRMQWWKDIVGYTIRGEYFWTGKGFGVNLADDDGYQVLRGSKLRTPHSVHMTFLARMGVPGLILWFATLASWAIAIGQAFFISRRKRQREWSNFFLFLGAFWVACLVNASFDVYLEGPMGGIWFWSIFGIGIAAVWIHTHHPHILQPTGQAAA